MVNQTLLTQIRAFNDQTAVLNANDFNQAVKAALAEAVLQFNLAPDLFVDVGRLPTSVTNIATLVAHLEDIKLKLAKKDNKTKNDEWDVAQSGELRLYKLYVCCIHALSNYLVATAVLDTNVTPNVFATTVCTHARTNVPGELAGKAKILWEKTFATEAGRTVKVMVSLVYFCRATATAGASSAGPKPPAPPSK
jgi:hypothetical protein